MRLISWNVNGIRAAVKKDFLSKLPELKPDVLCLQETKAQDEQVLAALGDKHGFQVVPHSAVKPGYSGTAILSRRQPLSVDFGLDIEQHDQEGRVITAEFEDLFLVTVYTPNSGSELKRLEYREQWDRDFQKHVEQLEIKKPVIICGDLNVCHQPIDIARPDANYNKSAGYTQIEIDGITNLLKAGYIDSFRHLYPDTVKYSWWSMRGGARARNVGWRLDYFLVSEKLAGRIKGAEILNDVYGSDHCPVVLELD
ncbi:MAG: exodeoxyribonuclease III [Gammaproteobacteria bacterium]|nr:exodeoxyribonuclease III [Gammaproteobacteria bacterium]|tara:strand:- start:534 stop:1295 length:762 start_codon:yes stop_codon:yes gene_type:complete